MANGAIKITWRDRNWAEHGHYIYRSDTPMDVNNLPSPITTIGVNDYEYIDYDVIADQTYYYRIGAFRNSDVSVSDEIEVIATPFNLGPGSVDFVGGDVTHGFLGEINATDFITGDALATSVGMTAGASQYSDTPWLKFSLNDEIIFIPKKSIRHTMTWEDVYQIGAVYGTGDNGLYPSGGNRLQDAIVNIDGYDFKVTLLKGSNIDPLTETPTGYDASWTHGSEWNKLMYPIHSGIHTNSSNTSTPSEPYNQWSNYSDSDLLTHRDFGNGSFNWVQETHATNINDRLLRGSIGVTYHNTTPYNNAFSNGGWRPALRLIQ